MSLGDGWIWPTSERALTIAPLAVCWGPARSPLTRPAFSARCLPGARWLQEHYRLGNAAVDAAAAASAEAWAVEGPLRQRRQFLLDVDAAQRILAAVQLAVVRADHGSRGCAPLRVRHKWAEVRRWMGRPLSVGPAPAVAGSVARPPGGLPDGYHDLRREGETFLCARCGRKAERARWTALTCSPYAPDPGAAVEPAQLEAGPLQDGAPLWRGGLRALRRMRLRGTPRSF